MTLIKGWGIICYSQERSISSAYIDSVLPDSMGELSEEYLQKMKEVWF